MDEIANVGEGGDGVAPFGDLLLRQAKHRGRQGDVLHTREFGVEAGSQLQKRGDPPGDRRGSGGRLKHAADDLEQRGLARPVAPDQRHRFPAPDRQVHVLERPELLIETALAAKEELKQPILRP
ncbi:hypothetical protein D3C72_2129490 [compost metagenome]